MQLKSDKALRTFREMFNPDHPRLGQLLRTLLQIATLSSVTPYESSADTLGAAEIQEVGAAQKKSNLLAGADCADGMPELFVHWQMGILPTAG